jgi:hypothetical protein
LAVVSIVLPIVSVVVVKFVTVAEAEVKTVMFPETLERVPEKPFAEFTGPLNEVDAIAISSCTSRSLVCASSARPV